MENPSLKRRRPYCHEDAPAEAHPSPPAGIDASSLSSDQRYILGQAASILNVHPSALLDIHRQQDPRFILEKAAVLLQVPVSSLRELALHQAHFGKRQRLNPSSEAPMSTPYAGSSPPQDAQEKSPQIGQQDRTSRNSRRTYPVMDEASSLLGWSSSRIAECLASFAICPPNSGYESDSGYQAVPTTEPYDYSNSRTMATTITSPANGRGPDPYAVNGHAEQTSLFACDDSAIVAQYMQHYPPMQPTRLTGDQPSKQREEIFYQEGLPNTHYFKPDESARDLAPTGPRLDPAPMGRSAYTGELMPVASSPTAAHQPVMGGAHMRYAMLPTYDSSADPFGQSGGLPLSSAESNLDVVFPNQKAPAAKRGPFKDHLERQKTAQTRKIGSCIRCRMQRIRCNADPENERGICIGCKKVSTKMWRLPCLRLKINDVILSKPGQVEGYEWTLRWKENSALDEIGNWASTEIKTIFVTEGYTGKHVELRVRQFIPQAGDRLERSWVTAEGVKKSVTIPPYAIVDMDAAKAAYDAYIKKGLVDCFKRLLGPKEKLLWSTYMLALKLTGDPSLSEKERELLASTLNLWMSIRLTTKSFEIVGKERLGMPTDIMDHTSPLPGKIPLPPVMGAQIDSILIHQIQARLRHNTLENLQKMTTENKQKTWLTTYLVTFILLHNTALLMKHDAGYARKHGIKRRFAREDKVKQYHLGAVTFLAYFHYCNKGIFPFSEECKDQDLKNLADLDDTAIEFVRYTRKYAIEQKGQWQALWDGDDYEDDYYFVSQLFEQNWQPRAMA